MLVLCSLDEFTERVSERRIVCFGAGKNLRCITDNYGRKIPFVIDSDQDKAGSAAAGGITIIGWDKLPGLIEDKDVLLITPSDFEEIYERIIQTSSLKDHEIYIYPLMERMQYDKDRGPLLDIPVSFHQKEIQRIPKRIHYFWFSGDPYPDSVEKCLESWKKYCPDYELIKWDKDNYDYTKNRFAREAIEQKKWAFAADVGRAEVVWKYGGIYLDLDVELVKNLDELLYHDAFIGFQDRDNVDPGSGFGAAPGNAIIEEFLEVYSDKPFVLADGTLNMIPCPRYMTDILEKHGLRRDGSFQFVDDIAVYPYDYFCPHSYQTDLINLTANTYSIHLHHGMWVNPKSKRIEQTARRLIKSALDI